MDTISLGGGRRLALHRLADGPAGRTVVLCHPAPGSGAFDPDPEVTHARGVTLLAPDRPGYGSSSPPADPRAQAPGQIGGNPADPRAQAPGQIGGDPAVARAQAAGPVGGDLADAQVQGLDRVGGDPADELAEALDRLGGGPVGVAGWSAGGLTALSLAARRPDLVDRLVLIATPAPDAEVPWFPPGLRAAAADLPTWDDPARWLDLLGAGAADRALLDHADVRARLTVMLREAFVQGPDGLAADLAACRRPPDVDLGRVTARTLLLYGAQDPLAGPRHGKWYQKRLPSARFEQLPDAGHLAAIPMWKRILSHLAPGAKRRPAG